MGMRVRVWLLLWAPLQHTLAIYVVVIVFFRCIENDNEGHVCGCVCDVRYRANWHRDTPGHLPPTPRQRVNGLGTGERGCSVLLAERAALPFVLRWKMMYNVLFLGAVESKYIYKYNIYNVYYHNRTTRTPPPPRNFILPPEDCCVWRRRGAAHLPSSRSTLSDVSIAIHTPWQTAVCFS